MKTVRTITLVLSIVLSLMWFNWTGGEHANDVLYLLAGVIMFALYGIMMHLKKQSP